MVPVKNEINLLLFRLLVFVVIGSFACILWRNFRFGSYSKKLWAHILCNQALTTPSSFCDVIFATKWNKICESHLILPWIKFSIHCTGHLDEIKERTNSDCHSIFKGNGIYKLKKKSIQIYDLSLNGQIFSN